MRSAIRSLVFLAAIILLGIVLTELAEQAQLWPELTTYQRALTVFTPLVLIWYYVESLQLDIRTMSWYNDRRKE